jgi:CheY-like chemotaxis protein
LHILNDVLDLSRIEAGKLEIQLTAFPLRDILRSTAALFRHTATEKGLEYELDLEPEVPPAALGDPDRLRQILVNLLSNAVKFTERGAVRCRASYQQGELRLCVEDSGPGVDPSLSSRLFEPFSQGDESSTRKFGGTGLGLSIVKRLCELMGGTIAYRPGQQGGSIFEARLPLPVAQASPSPARVAAAAPVIKPGLEVLVVEDNPVNRQVLDLQLSRLACRVQSAGDGTEALARLETSLPQLILMDCQMPRLDGYETTRRIRKMRLPRQPRIVALTAHAMTGERERCLEAGMDDFLPKPISLADLSRVVAETPRGDTATSPRP